MIAKVQCGCALWKGPAGEEASLGPRYHRGAMPDDAAGAARVLVRTFRGEVVDANVHAISLPWWV